MSGETIVTVVGNVTGTPELRFTNSGVAVANFTVASTPRHMRDGKWVDGDTLFMRCNVWRQPALHVNDSITKGDRVVVVGRLRQRSFEVDGQRRTVTELDVDEVGPSLRYASAKVTKATRTNGSEEAPADDEPPF